MVCEIIEVTGNGSAGKELVFEFSGHINLERVSGLIESLVKLLGGKDVYVEDHTKLVVVI